MTEGQVVRWGKRPITAFWLALAALLAWGCEDPIAPAPPSDDDDAEQRDPAPSLPSGAVSLDSASREDGIVGNISFGEHEASFESFIDEETGAAIAVVRGQDFEVAAELRSEADATVSFNGHSFDGYGPIAADEEEQLAQLAADPMAHALALIPLEVGCAVDADDTREQRAALLLPWQLLTKYAAQWPTVAAFEAAASCTYFRDAHEETIADTVADLPLGLSLSNADAVPHVFPYFPFDEAGAAEHATRGHGGVCGALCRGTCGPDCPTSNCTRTFEWYCVQSGGENTGTKRVRTHWHCGSHSGCRDHDNCYDGCNSTYGCGTWSAAYCRRGCDTICLMDHGVSDCNSWRTGGGPYDSYHDHAGSDQTDHTMCPPPDATGGMGGSGGAGTTGTGAYGGYPGTGAYGGSGGYGAYGGSGGYGAYGGSGGYGAYGGYPGTGAYGGYGAHGGYPGTGAYGGSGGYGSHTGTGAYGGYPSTGSY